jgi:glycosyltransferase involved in cell wall biosynthesis
MRILSDGWIYKYQKWGGINTYFDRLMYYTKSDCRWEVALDKPVDGLTFSKSEPKLGYPLSTYIHPRIDFHINRIKWWIKEHGSVDLYHPTYYDWISCHNWESLKNPIVCTLHDCIHERFPDHQKKDPFTVPTKRRMIERADQLICISQNTADDMDFFYPGYSNKIRVILSGTDFSAATMKEEPQLDYFSFVGTRNGYKNFSTLVKAVHLCNKTEPNITVKVSGEKFTENELNLFKSLGVEACFQWVGWLTEAELASFYYNSVALIYPSLYEGFGLPALDAMACGSTVIAHNGSSLPEVVGNGGILINAESVEQLKDAICDLLNADSSRKILISSATKQASKLSWVKTAEQSTQLYLKLL